MADAERITRPILFSGPMVRALLSGQKTQTRRIVKPQPTSWDANPALLMWKGDHFWPAEPPASPYGVPGDRLWVRETWTAAVAHAHGLDACDCADVDVTYPADGTTRHISEYAILDHEKATGRDWYLPKAAQAGKNVPAMFLPRFASRLTLEVTDVRVQRLQDISNEDAIAEGCPGGPDVEGYSERVPADPYEEFAILWDSINGDRADWNSNPWVWAISFKVIR
jgi:hypothetical protein